MTRDIANVTIYCASGSNIDRCFFDAARELAQRLAGKGIRCIYGAGSKGLMGCVADTFLHAGGCVTGVIPRFMVDNGWCHPGLSEVIVTDNMHERKTIMAQRGDATIALPGGCGTIEELMEIITWKQLGLYTHPIVILNTNGYYNPLLEMLRQAIDCHFMRDIHHDLWHVASTPAEAVDAIYRLPEWDKHLAKFD